MTQGRFHIPGESLDGRTVLERYSLPFFLLTLLCVVVGFWSSYFSHPFNLDPFVQFHAMTQTIWSVVLIGQVLAIRSGHLVLHRMIGNMSGWLVALVAASTIALMHHRLQEVPIDETRLKIIAFNFVTVLVFVLIYCLAIRYRRDPEVHAALMCSTVLPTFTAFGGRLIEQSNTLVALSVQTFGRVAALNHAALVPAELIALCLAIADWRNRRRLRIFPVVLLLLGAIHLSPAIFGHLPWWRLAVEWFVGLP